MYLAIRKEHKDLFLLNITRCQLANS